MGPQGQAPSSRPRTAVSGYGLRLFPRAPFVVVHGPHPPELDVEHAGPAGTRFGRLIADGQGGYRCLLDQHTRTPDEVWDLERAATGGDWRIESGRLRIRFPERYALYWAPDPSPSPFDLVGPGRVQIFVQTPLQMPPPASMCGPGQRIQASGAEWAEFSYEHQGVPWWQRHQIAGPYVFSAQSPATSMDLAKAGLEAIVQSLLLL